MRKLNLIAYVIVMLLSPAITKFMVDTFMLTGEYVTAQFMVNAVVLFVWTMITLFISDQSRW